MIDYCLCKLVEHSRRNIHAQNCLSFIDSPVELNHLLQVVFVEKDLVGILALLAFSLLIRLERQAHREAIGNVYDLAVNATKDYTYHNGSLITV